MKASKAAKSTKAAKPTKLAKPSKAAKSTKAAKNPIVSMAIYPPIGICRVGNSSEYYLAPEVPGQPAHAPGGFKDGTGRIKKQVVRFRIYGLDVDGNVVQELSANDEGVEIAWRVHVANRKAGWYQFMNALDLEGLSIPSAFRNGDVTGDARSQLIIDPGPRSICGKNLSGAQYHFTGGKFYDKEVPLGEIRTDEAGRLLVFGGDGDSASNTGAQATTFANNDGWHDDVSDGPVRATVTFNGQTFEAEPAIVVCTPPNFGQGLYGVVTMYDVVYDLYLREGWLQGPTTINFWQHIYPIFERMTQTQWVNAGFFMLFGHNSPSDFTAPQLVAQMADPSAAAKPLREKYFQWLRNPANPKPTPADFPPFYGDTFGDYDAVSDISLDLPFTATQYQWLEQWAAGNFSTEKPPAPRLFAQLTPAEQAHALCVAPLEECLGGPFHPGIEITWTLRQAITWAKPFRPKVLPEDQPMQDNFGALLAPAIALRKDGPLDGSGPGSMTRWLGVPWQTDEASCLSGYTASNYLPLPSFWAARVPNQILSIDSFKRLTDPALNIGQRLKHFDYRQDWLRDLGTQSLARKNNMIAEWHELGIITRHEAPSDHVADPANLLPSALWVETQRGPFEADPTYVQVLRAENAVPEKAPKPAKAPKVLKTALAVAEKLPRKAKSFGRNER